MTVGFHFSLTLETCNCLSPTVHPVITVPNQLVGAPIDTSVTLECQVAAFPNAVHFWRFNDQLLINSSRQETQEIRKGYTTTMKLSLRNLKTKDFGTYVCAAKNSLGETESNVRLYGQSKRLSCVERSVSCLCDIHPLIFMCLHSCALLYNI